MENISLITKAWNRLTDTVMDLSELPLGELQRVLAETYKILLKYKKDTLVPKEVTNMLLGMDEFLYFASVMEDNEKGSGYYYWQEIHTIAEAFKKGFFCGEFEYSYPELKVTDILDNDFIINLEKNSVKDLAHTLRRAAWENLSVYADKENL